MRFGLTIEEFVELERKPIARGDRPLSIEEAAEHIRQRGYCCRPQSLKLLMKGKPLEASNRIWTQDLIESCCDYFEAHEFFTPHYSPRTESLLDNQFWRVRIAAERFASPLLTVGA